MRCLKCGEKIPDNSKFCPICGSDFGKVADKKKSHHTAKSWALWMLVAIIVLSVAIGLIESSHAADHTKTALAIAPTLFLFFTIIAEVILVIYLLIANTKKIFFYLLHHPWLGIPVLLLIAASVYGGIHSYYNQQYKKLPENLTLVQETLSEVAAAKMMGDALAAGQTKVPAYFTWENVQNVANNLAIRLDGLKGSGLINDYRKSGIAWANQIRDAAKYPSTWKDVPQMPDNFSITLKQGQTKELYIKSLAKLVELTQFGSDAVRRNDKETIRYVAARLLTQEQWLKGLANYHKAGVFAELISPAKASGSSDDKSDMQRAQVLASSLKTAAWAYFTAENSAKSKVTADTWKKAVSDLSEDVAKADLAPLILAELIKDSELLPPNQQFVKDLARDVAQADLAPQALADLIKNAEKQPLPQVQAFKDECSTKGGTFGDGAQAMVGMPVLETGYVCNFKKQKNTCWDFMTYSGSGFSGGDSNCPELGLLPNYDQLKQEAEKQAQTAVSSQTKANKPSVEKNNFRDLGQPTGTAAPKIQFAAPQKLDAPVGQPFSYSFCQPAVNSASDLCTNTTNPKLGLPPYTFSLDSGGFLPLGLTINLNGLLEGTPTAAGNRTVKICAKDTGGFSVCRQVTINVGTSQRQDWTGLYSIDIRANNTTYPDGNCDIDGLEKIEVKNNVVRMVENLAVYADNSNLNTFPQEGGSIDPSGSAHLSVTAEERHMPTLPYDWHYSFSDDYQFFTDSNGHAAVKGSGTYKFDDSYFPDPSDRTFHYVCEYTISGIRQQ